MAQQPNKFAKPPFRGFCRRVTSHDRLPKKYNYIQKTHWYGDINDAGESLCLRCEEEYWAHMADEHSGAFDESEE